MHTLARRNTKIAELSLPRPPAYNAVFLLREAIFDNWGRTVSTGQYRLIVACRGARMPSLKACKKTNANNNVVGRIGFNSPVRLAA